MRILLAGLLAALVLALFGQSAILAAGDTWPGGGAVPAVIYLAGDTWPGAG